MTEPIKNVVFDVLADKDDKPTTEFCRQIWQEMGWPEEHLGPSILKDFQESGDVFLILKQEGEVVACGGLQKLSSEEVLMKRFYVAQPLRGSDVAPQLFTELVNRARDTGYSWLLLDVAVDNIRAIRFYQKHGVKEFAVTPHPRWYQSSPEAQKEYRFFRLKL